MSLDKDKNKTFDKIEHLYYLAEEMVDAIEEANTANPEIQVRAASSLVDTVNESADRLMEAFGRYVQKDSQPASRLSNMVDSATRKIFMGIDQFYEFASKNFLIDPEDPRYKKDEDVEVDIHKWEETKDPDADIGEPGPSQQKFIDLAKKLKRRFGGLLVEIVRRIGDHALYLARHLSRVYQLGNPEKAVPNAIARVKSTILAKRQGVEMASAWSIRSV